jgi:hypothetical protein
MIPTKRRVRPAGDKMHKLAGTPKWPLRDWAEKLLSERRLKEESLFEAAPIRDLWVEHLSGRGYGQHKLWDILMFQACQDRWMGASGGMAAASAHG